MRILIVSIFFPPINSIASLRTYSWANYWTLSGHDVTVLTLQENDAENYSTALRFINPGYRLVSVPNMGIIENLKKKYKGQETNFNKKNQGSPKKKWLHRLFHYLRFKKGIFNACRMPDFTDFWIPKAWKAIRAHAESTGGWDLVVSSCGPYAVHILANKLKRKGLAKRWIADYRDTWSNNYIYPGVFPFNWIESFLEKKLLKHADKITAVSSSFSDYFGKKYGKEKVQTVPNGFDRRDLDNLPRQNHFPEDGKYRIVHTGSIYLGKRDPSPLFQAIAEIESLGIHNKLLDRLEILFAGSRQANLEELIAAYRVEKWVKLIGMVSRESALCMQRDAHGLVFLPWNDPSVDGILTGKIFEYLFSGTQILAMGCPQIEASQQLILEAKAGQLLCDKEGIKSFLIRELSDIRKQKTTIDPNFLKQFDRQYLAEIILTGNNP